MMTQLPDSRPGTFIRTKDVSRRNHLKFNLALLFSLLSLIFVLPVIPYDEPLLTRTVLVLIVISGLFAAEFTAKLFRILAGLGTIVVAMVAISLVFVESTNLAIILFFLITLFFVIVTAALVANVAQAERVNGATLICAINSYLLIGLSMALLFVNLNLFAPNSFVNVESQSDAFSTFIYFAFVTLSTLGYGDISPITPLARSLATFTALFGQLYLVIIMALIIGKFLNSKGSEEELK